MVQSQWSVEDVMRSLKTLSEEGLFKHVGLSECAAETIRRAAKVRLSLHLPGTKEEADGICFGGHWVGVACRFIQLWP